MNGTIAMNGGFVMSSTQAHSRKGLKAHRVVHAVPAQFLLAAVLQSDWIVDQVQHELRRALPDLTTEQIRELLREKVLRPEILQGTEAEEALTLTRRAEQLRASGLTTTQTFKVLTDPSDPSEEEDVYRILLDDMHQSGFGG
jgi:hypothetical protein